MTAPKTLKFDLRFHAGASELAVEFYGGDQCVGISVQHWEHDRMGSIAIGSSPPLRIVSRTSPANVRKDEEVHVSRTSYGRLHTHYVDDPITAASQAIYEHVSHRILPQMGLEDDFTEPEMRERYDLDVVEPMCTAVIGLCRQPDLLSNLREDVSYWPVLRWTVIPTAVQPQTDTLEELGFQVLDVVLIASNDENRDKVKRLRGRW